MHGSADCSDLAYRVESDSYKVIVYIGIKVENKQLVAVRTLAKVEKKNSLWLVVQLSLLLQGHCNSWLFAGWLRELKLYGSNSLISVHFYS
jgi:hypothetical protein